MESQDERQARRLRETQDVFMRQYGAVDFYTLGQRRGEQRTEVALQVASWVIQQRVFTVRYQGDIVLPKVQFNADGTLNEPVAELVNMFLTTGALRDWTLWSWLCTATGWLSGEIPADVVLYDRERALRATQRHIDFLQSTYM